MTRIVDDHDGAPDPGSAVDPFTLSEDTLAAFARELDAMAADALDPYRGLRHLLPKLKQPSWVWHMHRARKALREPQPSVAAQKAERRNERKRSRFARALAGEHTRVTRAA